MRGRLNGCKPSRRVLNHEQAANEPTAYPPSISNMGYFRELLRHQIFLGTVLKGTECEDNDALWIIAVATNCHSLASFHWHVCFY